MSTDVAAATTNSSSPSLTSQTSAAPSFDLLTPADESPEQTISTPPLKPSSPSSLPSSSSPILSPTTPVPRVVPASLDTGRVRPVSVADQWLCSVQFTVDLSPSSALVLPRLPPPPRNPRAVAAVDDRRRRFSTSSARDWAASAGLSLSPTTPPTPTTPLCADRRNSASIATSPPLSSTAGPVQVGPPSMDSVSRCQADPPEIDFELFRQEDAPPIPPRPSAISIGSVDDYVNEDDDDDDENEYAAVSSSRLNDDAGSTATAYSGWETGSVSSADGPPSRPCNSPTTSRLPYLVRMSDGRLFRRRPLPAIPSAEFRSPAKPPKPPIVQLFWAGDFETQNGRE